MNEQPEKTDVICAKSSHRCFIFNHQIKQRSKRKQRPHFIPISDVPAIATTARVLSLKRIEEQHRRITRHILSVALQPKKKKLAPSVLYAAVEVDSKNSIHQHNLRCPRQSCHPLRRRSTYLHPYRNFPGPRRPITPGPLPPCHDRPIRSGVTNAPERPFASRRR